MLQEFTNDGVDTQIEDIDIASKLLRRMLTELQDLEVKCARLHFAMSKSGHAIRQELDLLSGIAGLLKSGQAPLRAQELGQLAKMLISHLAAELEELSLQSELDLQMDHLPALPRRPAM